VDPTAKQVEGSDDVHWDYVLKELMWLSADFASEWKRQISQAKRLSSAVMSYHNTRRLQKELAELELRKRKIASKISKIVMKQFWVKVECLITYKQYLV
jgi:3-dehydroquinate dehydratase